MIPRTGLRTDVIGAWREEREEVEAVRVRGRVAGDSRSYVGSSDSRSGQWVSVVRVGDLSGDDTLGGLGETKSGERANGKRQPDGGGDPLPK